MALSKSVIEPSNGAVALYHKLSDIHVTQNDVSYILLSFVSEDERNGQARFMSRRSYSKSITSSEYDAGITPASLYTDIKATDEFDGASDA